MAVALKRKQAAKSLPKSLDLCIGITSPLSKQSQKALDEYHAACVDAERAIDELHDARAELLRSARDAAVGDLIDSGAQLEMRRVELESELESLHHRRAELLPQLLPDLEKAVAAALADRDQLVACERDRLESLGVTVAAMPGAFTNPVAAQQQLEHRISQTDTVLAGQARFNIATAELRSWSAAAKAATPRPERWVIPWRSTGLGFESAVAALAGV